MQGVSTIERVGQAAVINCHQVCSRQCIAYPFDSTQPLADHRKVVLKSRKHKVFVKSRVRDQTIKQKNFLG